MPEFSFKASISHLYLSSYNASETIYRSAGELLVSFQIVSLYYMGISFIFMLTDVVPKLSQFSFP